MGHTRRKRRSRSTLSENAKYIGLVIVFAVVVFLVVLALNRTPPVTAQSTPRPIPTFAEETAAPAKPTAVFIGDSYTVGAGGTDTSKGFATLTAASQGWDAQNLGRGGTGYLKTSGQVGCGLDYCPNYQEMIAEIPAGTEIIFVAGGRNDAGLDSSEVDAAIVAFYTQLRATFPEAEIIAASPIWDDDPTPEQVSQIASTVMTNVEAVGGRYLSIGEPLTGQVDLLSPDGVHPNDQGYVAIAAAIEAALAS